MVNQNSFLDKLGKKGIVHNDESNYYFFAVEQMDSDKGGGDPVALLRKAPAADGEFNGCACCGCYTEVGSHLGQHQETIGTSCKSGSARTLERR